MVESDEPPNKMGSRASKRPSADSHAPAGRKRKRHADTQLAYSRSAGTLTQTTKGRRCVVSYSTAACTAAFWRRMNLITAPWPTPPIRAIRAPNPLSIYGWGLGGRGRFGGRGGEGGGRAEGTRSWDAPAGGVACAPFMNYYYYFRSTTCTLCSTVYCTYHTHIYYEYNYAATEATIGYRTIREFHR